MLMDSWLGQILLLVIAVISNTLSAAAGGGAGLIQLPALIFLGLPFSIALATHKVASVALGIGASIRHLRHGSLQLKTSIIVVCAGLPGVILGANTILFIAENSAKTALGILTIGLSLYSFIKPNLGQTTTIKPETWQYQSIGAGVLFFFGFLNGSLTSGTGLFVTLWLIRWFGFDYQKAIAHTLVLVGLFWNSTGAITLGLQQAIQWNWLAALVLGSIIGGFLGAHLSIIKGNHFIKRLFEIITLVIGIKLLF